MTKANKNTYFDSITQFKFFQTKRLGRGSFGEVKLALHLQTSKIYAIKIIDSNQVTSQIGAKALERQIALHASINHPHIIKVWEVLKQGSKIYMIMEYAENGNLFYYQNQKKSFSEEDASIFFTQVLNALDYLHSLNLIHRDIKPQNLLLDKDLNIKICDLGWITSGINNMHTTFCGTYQYMAPEMIFQHSYDHRIDIWALGVLLYQLLHGCAPFQGQKAQEVRVAMLSGQIQIDPQLSDNVQNLIFNILKVDPAQRLTIKKIKNHPWVLEMKKRKHINMDSIINKQINEQDKGQFKNFPKLGQELNDFSQKKYESLKTVERKAIQLLKKKKNLNKNIKMNHSTQQIRCKKLSKQKKKMKQNKENKLFGKIMKEISAKKLIKGHKSQKSQFSQLFKYSRLKTDIRDGGKTMKYSEFGRFNTQAGEGMQPLDERSTIKKRNMIGKKNDIYLTNATKNGSKVKLTRKSID